MPRPGPREMASVLRVMARGDLMRYASDSGSATSRFEAGLRERIGVAHALTVNSGTSALICALAGLGVGPGDEVLVPAYTWVSTAAAPLALGAVPVLVEIDESLTMDPADLERKVTPRSRAVIPVHMQNVVCAMDELLAVAGRHDLLVVEDACQAVGASYRGRRVGSFGHAAAFSFNQHKNLSSGEGGAVLTDDPRVHARARMFHDVGSYTRAEAFEADEPIFVGMNLRVSELTAAMLLPQLHRLDRLLARRRAQREVVVEALSGVAGARISPHHAPQDAVGVSVVLDDAAAAERFGSARGAVRLIDTHRHVYTNWESVRARRTWHPRADPWACAGPGVTYDEDACPRTLDVLARTCTVTLDPRLPVAAMAVQARALRRALQRATGGA